MKKIIPMLFTSIGGFLGSLYGYLTVLATIPALIASDLPMSVDFVATFQNHYFYILSPFVFVFGWWIGAWRAKQIESLENWRKWAGLLLLGLIVAVLGYSASLVLFLILA